mgnify:CR=1 FL=1
MTLVDALPDEPTADALGAAVDLEPMDPALVKGRDTPVHAFRVAAGVLP